VAIKPIKLFGIDTNYKGIFMASSIVYRKIKSILILVLVCSFYNLAVQAKAVTVPFVSSKINRDANFNNKIWNKAAVFSEFVSGDGSPATQITKLLLLHDQYNLYVGFKCFGQSPTKLVSVPRHLPDGDAVFLVLDSFHDGLAAYIYGSSPDADKQPGVLSDFSPHLRFAFDANYAAVRKLRPYGYNVEMIIPFKSFPYHWNKNSTVMGLRAVRTVHKKSELYYPYVMSDRQGGSIIQYQPIKLAHIPKSQYKKPWFSVDAIAKAREKIAAGYDLNTFKGRSEGWGITDGSVADYKIFPFHSLHPSKHPKPLKAALKTKCVEKQFNDIDYYPRRPIGDLERFLKRTQTTSFIVLHNNKIIYEHYFNGFKPSSIAPSFSMAKSFLSALIGIAVEKKQIHSINDPITKYLPELLKQDRNFSRITIKDLLQMSAGIRALEGKPYDDFRKAYFSPNLRHLLLQSLKIVEPPNRHFLYTDYCAQLAGLILTRATHHNAIYLLQHELWDSLGMQYGGSWSIDSKDDNLEQMAVGINTPAISYAKFGLLYLQNGKWGGKQIIPASWVTTSTQPTPVKQGFYPNWGGDRYYKYFWWGLKRASKAGDKNDFLAIGHRGQYLYISPQKHLVIVRTGVSPGIKDDFDWANVFYQFASKFQMSKRCS
jgi:CubicO group peptidase (beta-lactamase class C family)